jgi:hypothetical protein
MGLREFYTYSKREHELNLQQVQKDAALIARRKKEAVLERPPKTHECEKECAYTKLKSKFSATILAKLLEYNLDPFSITPNEALKKLLTLGMPVQYARQDLENNGFNTKIACDLLSKHGLSAHLNNALAQGVNGLSTSSAVSYAEAIIARHKQTNLQDPLKIATSSISQA